MPSRRKKPKAAVKSKAQKQAEAKARRTAYATYLESEIWCSIRSAVLAMRPQCELCGERATQVHHDSYHASVMTGERTDSLVSICRPCHVGIEFGDGQKLTSKEVRRKLRKMLIASGREAIAERLKESQRQISGHREYKPTPPPINRELEKRKRDAEIARKAREGDPKAKRPVSRWMSTRVVRDFRDKPGPLSILRDSQPSQSRNRPTG